MSTWDRFTETFFNAKVMAKYLPDIAVINNIEFDHADIYPDFDAVQIDYERRFKLLPDHLAVMRKVWAGEAVYGPALSVWPGTEGGPPVYLGAWRSPRWIDLAARHCDGWIASGIYASPDDLPIGLDMFRKAGGKRAILGAAEHDDFVFGGVIGLNIDSGRHGSPPGSVGSHVTESPGRHQRYTAPSKSLAGLTCSRQPTRVAGN